jgi:hypothetical protein
MKICGWCGGRNPDEATECSECGTPVKQGGEALPAQDFREWFNRPASARLKCYLWYATWGGVILVTLAIKPASILTAPCFPVGLLALLPNGDSKAILAAMTVIPILVGWALYVLLSVLMARTRRRGSFLLLYLAFCLLLALNLVGCQRALEAASQIQ